MVDAIGGDIAPASSTDSERSTSTRGWGHLSRITPFLTVEPRVGCHRPHDAGRQKNGDEVSVGTMELRGSSVTSVSGATQGDHEKRIMDETASRQRGAETPKTPDTKRRKRPISSFDTLDEWVNKLGEDPLKNTLLKKQM